MIKGAAEVSGRSLETSVLRPHQGGNLRFLMLPGDASPKQRSRPRGACTRTPVREALYRLEREGYIDVSPRKRLEREAFRFPAVRESLRRAGRLELAAVRKLCEWRAGPI